MPINLKAVTRDVIINQIIKGSATDSQWKVLVVDKDALKMISSCCRMFDITDAGVTVVENIEKVHVPMPKFDVIYLCSPTLENVDYMLRDFGVVSRLVDKPQPPSYKSLHLYLIDACPPKELEAIGQLAKYTKTFKEVPLNFVPKESQVFLLDDPRGMGYFYGSFYASQRTIEQKSAARLAAVCAILGEDPYVRYQATANTKVESFAREVKKALAEARESSAPAQQKRSQILIIDRATDLTSLLVHELTYQAAAYDLADIDNDTYTYSFTDGSGKPQTRNALLNEDDEVWVQFRHKHIMAVLRELPQQFKDFNRQVESSSKKNEGDSSKQLRQMLKDYPQHREIVAKYSLHFNLSDKIQGFDKRTETCIRTEQDIVMGVDADGEKIKNYVEVLGPVIVDSQISAQNKLRCILLSILATNGMDSKALDDVLSNAEISEEDFIILENLRSFGVSVTPPDKKKKKKARKERENLLVLSRWTPILKDILEDFFTERLSLDDFPFMGAAPSSGSKSTPMEEEVGAVESARKKKWGKKTARESEAQIDGSSDRNRLIVFVVGGIGYNEARVIAEVSAAAPAWDIVIGSHELLTPLKFLDRVKTLNGGPTTEHRGSTPVNLVNETHI